MLLTPFYKQSLFGCATRSEDEDWLFAGRRRTSFSDDEEVELGTADNAPWLLAETLRCAGVVYEEGPNWGPHVVTDRLSGQNPALAEAVIKALA